MVIKLRMYVYAHEQYFSKRNESLCVYVTLGFVITRLNFSGECCKQERAREPLQKKKTTKALPNLSSGTLGDNQLLEKFRESDTEHVDLPSVTTFPVPTADEPICLRLKPKINSLTPPHPPREHTHPSVALTRTHTLLLP